MTDRPATEPRTANGLRDAVAEILADADHPQCRAAGPIAEANCIVEGLFHRGWHIEAAQWAALLDQRVEVQHAQDAINAALDKASYGDSVESDLLEAHATLDTLLSEGAAPRAEGLARKIADRMALAYNRSTTRAADVAKACDEAIDPTGNLLGWLRDYALLSRPSDEEKP